MGKLLQKRKSQELDENLGTPSEAFADLQPNSEPSMFSPGIKQYGNKAKCSRCKEWKSREHFQHGVESSQVSLGVCLSCRILLKTKHGESDVMTGKPLKTSNGNKIGGSASPVQSRYFEKANKNKPGVRFC